MLPITLSFEKLSILLIGQGEKLRAREAKLIELGIGKLTVIEPPFGKITFRNFDIVMIVGLDEETSAKFYAKAKAVKALVNVEDNKKFCDFHFPSYLKRGALVISVSSNGHSPATSRIIRDHLAKEFPEIWGDRIEEIAAKRKEWKAAGFSYDEVNENTKDYIKKNNWLS